MSAQAHSPETRQEFVAAPHAHAADAAGACRHPGLADGGSHRLPVGHVLLLVAVGSALFLLRAGSLPLADPEESRCALIVREMAASGDWLLPHAEGQPYYDKPAPFFWLAALAQAATGSEELGGRLVVALAGLACVLVTWSMARRLFGDLAGLLAGLILATSAGFFFMARWYRVDMPFVAAMWAAIWWLWRARRTGEPADEPRPDPRRGWAGFYVFAGIATALKGPAGLGLPLLIVLIHDLLCRQPRRLLGALRPVALGLYLLIVAPWYVAVSLHQPGYAYEFFVRQNLLRYTGGGDLGHTWPGLLYVPMLLVGLLPWTIYLPGAAIRQFPRRWRDLRERPDLLLLWLTALVTVAFFAFSRTKLPNYILPAFPPLAVLIASLIAAWTTSHRPDPLMRHGARALLVAVLLMPLALLGAEVYLGNVDLWIALPIAAAGLAAWRMAAALGRAKRRRFVGWAVAAVVAVATFVIGHLAPAAYDRMSTRSLAALVPPVQDGQRGICFWGRKELSFLLYTRADDWVKFPVSNPASLNLLAHRMRAEESVYCLVSGRQQMDGLRSACGDAFRELGRSGDRWVVTNVDPPPRRGIGPPAGANVDPRPGANVDPRPGANVDPRPGRSPASAPAGAAQAAVDRW